MFYHQTQFAVAFFFATFHLTFAVFNHGIYYYCLKAWITVLIFENMFFFGGLQLFCHLQFNNIVKYKVEFILSTCTTVHTNIIIIFLFG